MILSETSNCLYFANQNPEISLPANIDVDFNENGVCTPQKSTSDRCASDGTAVCIATPEAAGKSRPFGLSHPYKIP